MMFNLYTRLLLLLCMLTATAGAQPRRNAPLPQLNSSPYAELRDSIIGWSRSTDGQWISRTQVIPPIGISRDNKFYDSKDAQLGIDNIRALKTYKMRYGRDTLVALVKIFEDGAYKSPLRQRGWRTKDNAYYIVVNYRYLRQAIKSVQNDDVHVLRIEAMDGKLLADIKEKKLLEKIKANLIIKDKYDRNLVLTVQLLKKEGLARFHICTMHEVFPDVEGVRKNFTRRGRTVYGSKTLFDYLYFEVDYYRFMSLFTVPDEISLEELEAMD